MKRTLELKEDSSSTTPEITNKLQIKENNHFFNSVDKLAADHDVYVSNTMIKVTYKKALKDQNTTDNAVDARGERVFTKSMNYSELNKKKRKYIKAMDLCSSEISLISKSPKVHTEGGKAFAYQSTPKPQALPTEKKTKYVNGLSVSAKLNNVKRKSSPAKVQKGFSSQEDGTWQSPRKSKPISPKAATKPEVNKRFLKGNNSLVKPKANIQKNSVETKKMELCKVASKKHKQLESSEKKKVEVFKELKRKASNTDLNVLAKKIKVSENKIKRLEENGKFEDKYKLGDGKRPIMLVDPELPTGWTRYIRTKNKGSANEQYVVYVVNPQGKKFRFKWKLRKYLETTNSSLDVDRFFFGLYERPKSTTTVDRHDESKNDKVSVSEGKSLDGSGTQSYKNSAPRNSKQDEGSNNDSGKSSDGKELLLYDPNLPFGWKRVIHSNISSGKKQVHIISPDGKIFRRRYKLNEYLIKHQYTHNLDRFYFGLYPKKDGNASENSRMESEEKTSNSVKSNNHTSNNEPVRKGNRKRAQDDNSCRSLVGNRQLRLILRKIDECGADKHESFVKINESAILNSEIENDSSEIKDGSKLGTSNGGPMYDDPNLPEGWKRFIKTRSCGESAGRMEVVIVSPDGRRHRSKKHLEHYLLQKELGYKAEDFDFHVFGKSSQKKRSDAAREPEPEPEPVSEPDTEPRDITFLSLKKKFTDKPVPELDIDSLKDIVISPEGHMINAVNGLMMSCGLTSPRNERRQRLPRGEHEKQLKSHLSSEGDVSCNGCEIPAHWIQRLVKCRGDFRTLEADAASTVGEAAKDFIKTISFLAFSTSKQADRGLLRYEDVAELVHGTKSLSPLQTLIPRKITYKEYIKLNRPKQFLSFT